MDKRLKSLEKEQDDMMAIIEGIPDVKDELEDYLGEIKADVAEIIEEQDRQNQEDTAGNVSIFRKSGKRNGA